MKILIASDFFTDFELIEAPSREVAEEYILANFNYAEAPQVTILGSQDTMATEEATYQADTILYISDYESEELWHYTQYFIKTGTKNID